VCDAAGSHQRILDRHGIDLRVETHALHDDPAAASAPWLATLTYHHVVQVELGLAWLTPGMPPWRTVEALAAAGITDDEMPPALRRTAAGESAVVVCYIGPDRPARSILHDTLAAYATFGAADIMRADTVWTLRRHVPARVRGLLGVRGRQALAPVDRAGLEEARAQLAAELFADEPATPVGHGPLRLVAGDSSG
jgi:hypothetical protein